MNILVFSWRDPKHPLAGGAEQVMHEHMKGWIEAGHKVTLFSSKFINYKKEEYLDGVRIIRSGRQYIDVQIRGCLWYLFGNHEKFDVVVDQFHGIPFFTPLYVRVKKLAVLQEVAREVWFANYLPKPFNWIIGAVGYVVEPFIFLFYKNTPFIVGSQSAKEDLMKMGINKAHINVVPHGVIIKIPSPMPKKEKKETITFLGVLQEDKGIEDAVRTFGLLSKMGDFQFWVIGQGADIYIEKLKNLCKHIGVEGKVTFWGFVSQEEKFKLLAKSHILLNPSLREGWGLVNIEANSMETPVVAYKSPGLVDSVKSGQSGIVVSENSPEALSKEVVKIMDSKKEYESLSRGDKHSVSSFIISIPIGILAVVLIIPLNLLSIVCNVLSKLFPEKPNLFPVNYLVVAKK